ncbi:MAG: hypothetical protein M1337_04630, partial [Actinobacteria bacterium]|nr:hypothetical protein [Actinomycetota bacterium]
LPWVVYWSHMMKHRILVLMALTAALVIALAGVAQATALNTLEKWATAGDVLVGAYITTPSTAFSTGSATRKAYVATYSGNGNKVAEAGIVFYPGITNGQCKSYYQYIDSNGVVQYVELSNQAWGQSRYYQITEYGVDDFYTINIAGQDRVTTPFPPAGTAPYPRYGVRTSNATDKFWANFSSARTVLGLFSSSGSWHPLSPDTSTLTKTVHTVDSNVDIAR